MCGARTSACSGRSGNGGVASGSLLITTCPPTPPHRCPGPQAAGCPGAELSTVAFSSSGHCGKTVLHI